MERKLVRDQELTGIGHHKSLALQPVVLWYKHYSMIVQCSFLLFLLYIVHCTNKFIRVHKQFKLVTVHHACHKSS